MSISLAQYKGNSASSKTSVTVEFADSQTAGNFNVVGIFIDTEEVTSVTDTNGNTYSLAVSDTPESDYFVYLYYATDIASGSDNTITIECGTATDIWVIAAEFSGVAIKSPLDETGTNTGTNSNPGSVDVTCNTVGELLIAMSGGSEGIGDVTGGTEVTTEGNAGMLYQVTSETGTLTPEFHYGADAGWTVVGATFKLPSASGSENRMRWRNRNLN